MKARLAAVVVLLAVLGALVVAPLTTKAAPPAGGASLRNIDGTLTNLVATVDQAGNVLISGTFTDTAGNVTTFTTTLLNTTGSCQILHLTLGPLDLNLLGLMVHLDRVVLDIRAQAGSGNLLGNLLCGVAHLLDPNALATALNNIFALL